MFVHLKLRFLVLQPLCPGLEAIVEPAAHVYAGLAGTGFGPPIPLKPVAECPLPLVGSQPASSPPPDRGVPPFPQLIETAPFSTQA